MSRVSRVCPGFPGFFSPVPVLRWFVRNDPERSCVCSVQAQKHRPQVRSRGHTVQTDDRNAQDYRHWTSSASGDTPDRTEDTVGVTWGPEEAQAVLCYICTCLLLPPQMSACPKRKRQAHRTAQTVQSQCATPRPYCHEQQIVPSRMLRRPARCATSDARQQASTRARSRAHHTQQNTCPRRNASTCT